MDNSNNSSRQINNVLAHFSS